MHIAIQQLTAAILGAKGGAVRHLDTDGDDMPDTLYIADNPDPAKAVKVWRFNYEGWAASKNGYSGPFVMGASFDSGILADFITAGTLYGLLIKAGTIMSEDGRVKIDLNTQGAQAIFNTSIRTNGLYVQSEADNSKPVFDVSSSADRLLSLYLRNPENGEALCAINTPIGVDGKVVGISGSIRNAGVTRAIEFNVTNLGAEMRIGDPKDDAKDFPIRVLLQDGIGSIRADKFQTGSCTIDSSCAFVWSNELGRYVLTQP